MFRIKEIPDNMTRGPFQPSVVFNDIQRLKCVICPTWPGRTPIDIGEVTQNLYLTAWPADCQMRRRGT